MTRTAALAPPTAPGAPPARRPDQVDNRAAYTAFALAYLLGHGTAAASGGENPLLDLPGPLPGTLLGTGLVAGITLATLAALRVQRTATAPEVLSGKLLGAAWIVAFAALGLAVTGLASTLGAPEVHTLLWPTGSGLIVGLLYLAEGAVRRNPLHYGLGVWLALTSSAALALDVPGPAWVLAVAGGGAYAVATVLEHRRLRPSAPDRRS
ncbi:ABC transporter permease [Streptomyces sp. NPDC091027]|uniref:ABC transporter permease n=1 Tax=Streptomyces sp. NPDC091027 TaxID=3365971 RepID=UPI0037F3F457